MNNSIDLSCVLANLDTWTTEEMLMLRAELIRRLETSDSLQSLIHAMAKEFALQEINNLPEVKSIVNEIARVEEENKQHKAELAALGVQIQSFTEENDSRNQWLQ